MPYLCGRSREPFPAGHGTVQALQEPAGPGVRVDSSLYQGLQVPLFYDPLLAKLIVWGNDRLQAIARMRRALTEYQVLGVRTTLPFARWLMENPRFIEGDMSTDFVAEEWDTRSPGRPRGSPLHEDTWGPGRPQGSPLHNVEATLVTAQDE